MTTCPVDIRRWGPLVYESRTKRDFFGQREVSNQSKNGTLDQEVLSVIKRQKDPKRNNIFTETEGWEM